MPRSPGSLVARLLALLPWYDPDEVEARHKASTLTLQRAQAARQAKVDVIERYRHQDAALRRASHQ